MCKCLIFECLLGCLKFVKFIDSIGAPVISCPYYVNMVFRGRYQYYNICLANNYQEF